MNGAASHRDRDARSRHAVWLVMAAALAAAWMALRWPLPLWMLGDNDWLHQLAGANQILHGEHPFIDWHTDYGPLRYYPSALAQLLLGPRTLSELLLVTAAYTAAYTLLYHLLWVASRRRSVAAALLIVALILAPRLFKYYVMLGAVGCLWAAWHYIERPSRSSLAILAAGVVITGLFRADFGGFAALAALVAIASRPEPFPARVRHVAGFLALAVLCLAPWVAWLTLRGGLGTYLVDTILVGPGHAAEMALPFPRFDASAPLSADNALFLLYACYYALPAIAVGVALWPGVCPERSERRKIITAAVLAQAVLLHAAHRSDYSHLLQAIPVDYVLLAWLAGKALSRLGGTATGFVGRVALAVLGVALAVSLWAGVRVGGWPSPYAGQGLAALRYHAMERGELLGYLAATAPDDSRVQAIQYVRRCMSAGDRIVALQPWTALYYFGDRMFAGGLPNWSPGFFNRDSDQTRWIETVRRQHARLILGDFSRQLDARPERTFSAYSPLVAAYVAEHYAPIGSFGPIVVRAPATSPTTSAGGEGPPPCPP